MRRWHYSAVTLTLGELMDVDWLNGYGEQGLELICLERISGNPPKWVAVFKKEFISETKAGS